MYMEREMRQQKDSSNQREGHRSRGTAFVDEANGSHRIRLDSIVLEE